MEAYLSSLTPEEIIELQESWYEWGRPGQQVPSGNWYIWLLLTGRGWGKNRTMSETAHQWAEEMPGSHGALVARTAADVRDTVVRGVSGILATAKQSNPCKYTQANRVITWQNGTSAHTYTSEQPDQLRGPNHHWAICDEWATWTAVKAADGGTAWDHVQFSTRLAWHGISPRIVIGTTPRPTREMRDLITHPKVKVTAGSMLENTSNLSPMFMAQIRERYEGTRMGRQEISGEILELLENALVSIDWINADRIAPGKEPEMTRVVVAVDPAMTAGERSDKTGIIVAGRGKDKHGYILADLTIKGRPDQWGRRAVSAYHDFKADLIIGEGNNGGDLVKSNILTINPNLRVKIVNASRGKKKRFEPISALYEQHRIHHVGIFEALEDQICLFDEEDYQGDGSPDEADAAVWALSELMLGRRPAREIAAPVDFGLGTNPRWDIG